MSRYAVFKSLFELKHVDAIKLSLAARSTKKWFPPTTLIRLYELLKNNSRPAGLLSPGANDASRKHCGCLDWWRMTGSNRRPPACKAGALPAELIPREDGGSGWSRTNDPRLIKTVL